MSLSKSYPLAGQRLSRSEILSRSKALRPIVQIGKNGLSEGSLEEIQKHLKKRNLIKVKCLRYSINPELDAKTQLDEMAARISKKTAAEIISITGFAMVFYFHERRLS